MKVIDLFSGVGGLSEGFVMKGFEIAFAVEIDTSIANSYKLNHPDVDMYSEDITQIDLNMLFNKYPDINVVIGGPPCQGFSQKGKRLSIKDSRNYLFQYFVKFVAKFEPEYFLLENVPNIITTSSGYFKEEIIKAFTELGYSVDNKVLNALNFGVPQDRKRAFFLGKKGNKMLPLPEVDGNKSRPTIRDAIYDLPFIESGEGSDISKYDKPTSTEYQKMLRQGSQVLHNHKATRHSKIALERLSLIPKGKGRESLPAHHLTNSIFSGTWCRLKEDGVATTITTRFDTPSSGMFTHPILNRCLTVREAARIQSFPDTFVFYGNKTSQMKQVGNAVPPLMVKKIAEIINKDKR